MKWKDRDGIEHDDYFISVLPCYLCDDCKHLRTSFTNPPTCDAFPKGIPEKVWTGEIKHTVPIDGDNGIQFEDDFPYDDESLEDLPELLYDE